MGLYEDQDNFLAARLANLCLRSKSVAEQCAIGRGLRWRRRDAFAPTLRNRNSALDEIPLLTHHV